MLISGRCHCGNISFRLDWRPASRVEKYAFGTQTADFHVCRTCDVVPLDLARRGTLRSAVETR